MKRPDLQYPKRLLTKDIRLTIAGVIILIVAFSIVNQSFIRSVAQDTASQSSVQVKNNAGPTTVTNTPAPTHKQTASPAKYEVYPLGGAPTSNATVWMTDGAATAVNPADLRLYGEVKNIGGQSGTPECTIQAYDASYSYSGIDVVVRTSPLKSGGIWDWHDDLTVSNEGAQYITHIEVNCQNQ